LFQLPSLLISRRKDLRIAGDHFIVLLYLMANLDEGCHEPSSTMSIAYLSAACGFSDSSLRRRLGELERLEYIKRVAGVDVDGGCRPNTYNLQGLIDACEKLASGETALSAPNAQATHEAKTRPETIADLFCGDKRSFFRSHFLKSA
jgi:hypothetical protein